MPKNIHNLPVEITDKIFKEFLGFSEYRWSKTGKLFTWGKLNKEDFRYLLFKFRNKDVDFTSFPHWNRIRIKRQLSKKPWHYIQIDYLYDQPNDAVIYAFEKRQARRAPAPANHSFHCLLSDIYEKNDSFKKAIKSTENKSYTYP